MERQLEDSKVSKVLRPPAAHGFAPQHAAFCRITPSYADVAPRLAHTHLVLMLEAPFDGPFIATACPVQSVLKG